MKKILVTRANSYIGKAFLQYVEKFPDAYRADSISLRDENWREADFSRYETVLHAAGLAHIKETEASRPLYYKINRDLAAETARKAKAEGVGQFIFLSSMSVYGMEEGIITQDTIPRPESSYGKSKLEAEQLLQEMRTESFRVAILRPPMVYGKGCKGNFQTLVRLAGCLPVCPDYENRRSAVFVGNLCAYIRETVDCEGGCYVTYTYRDGDQEANAKLYQEAAACIEASPVLEPDVRPGHLSMGHIITPPEVIAAQGWAQMEAFIPVKLKKETSECQV